MDPPLPCSKTMTDSNLLPILTLAQKTALKRLKAGCLSLSSYTALDAGYVHHATARVLRQYQLAEVRGNAPNGAILIGLTPRGREILALLGD